jgi:hypothetical protein
MPASTLIQQDVRVPALPMGTMVDKDGNPTDDELLFRTQLITSLQRNFNNEGLVAPTQGNAASPNDYVTQIQNHQNIQGQYTCQLGTILYVIPDAADYTQDKVMIAVRNDNTYPSTPPLFKTVTLV